MHYYKDDNGKKMEDRRKGYTFSIQQLLGIAALLVILSGSVTSLFINNPAKICENQNREINYKLESHHERIADNSAQILVLQARYKRMETVLENLEKKTDRILEIIIRRDGGEK